MHITLPCNIHNCCLPLLQASWLEQLLKALADSTSVGCNEYKELRNWCSKSFAFGTLTYIIISKKNIYFAKHITALYLRH